MSRDKASKEFAKELSEGLGLSIKTGMTKKNDLESQRWYSLGNAAVDFNINYRGLGIPAGHVTELSGASASGKTMLALEAIASCQKQGGWGVYIGTEGALDADYAANLGVDLEKLTVIEPTYALVYKAGKKEVVIEDHPVLMADLFLQLEELVDRFKRLKGSDFPVVFVWDSITGTKTAEEMGLKETSSGGYRQTKGGKFTLDRGLKARRIRGWLSRFSSRIKGTQIAFVTVNHVYSSMDYSNEEITSGGKAPRYFSQVRLRLEKLPKHERFEHNDAGRVVGEKFRVKVIKNQIGLSYGECTITFLFRKDGKLGLDYYSGYKDYLVQNELVEQNGSWYCVDGDNYQGWKWEEIIKDHPELRGPYDPDK